MTTSTDADPVQRVLDRVEHRRQGAGWMANCPAHDDGTKSLSINRGDNGNALMRCQAGCETEDVVAAIGLDMGALFVDGKARPRGVWRGSGQPINGTARQRPGTPPSGRNGASRTRTASTDGRATKRAPRTEVANYDYTDERGTVLFTKVRFEPKGFSVKRPGDVWGIGDDTRRVLYRLPDVLAAARSGQPVHVVEGEKDADRLASLGLIATCNFDGAGSGRPKWKPEYGDTLSGADVVIIRDLDDAGAAHALAAFDDLTGKAAAVRIVAPATEREHDDVSDHLDAGFGVDALVAVDPAELRRSLKPDAPEATADAAPDGGGGADDALDDEALNALELPVLPGEFWEARPVLRHIRQAAHARNRSADVLLYGTLARAAAMRSHHVGAETGVGAGFASLNLLMALVGRSGAGKSSGNSGSRHLLPVRSGVELLDGVPLGTGEGVAEAFMGTRFTEAPGANGRTRQVRQRVQTRHNALFYLDEGEALTKMLERAGTTVGPTLRSAWGGETLGQQNASDDRTRIIRDYSLGIVIGFQPTTVMPLLDDADAGTPQRFLYASATDPNIPDVRVTHPGPLDLDVAALASPGDGHVDFCEAVREEIYSTDLDHARGRHVPALLDSHEALSRVKIAALLALLEGRREVTAEDWALALTVWQTSCAVRDRLVEHGERRKRRREAVRRWTYVGDQVSAAVAMEDERVVRVARRITDIVERATSSSPKPYEVRKRVAQRDREVFETALSYAVGLRWLGKAADGSLMVGTSQPTEDAS